MPSIRIDDQPGPPVSLANRTKWSRRLPCSASMPSAANTARAGANFAPFREAPPWVHQGLAPRQVIAYQAAALFMQQAIDLS